MYACIQSVSTFYKMQVRKCFMSLLYVQFHELHKGAFIREAFIATNSCSMNVSCATGNCHKNQGIPAWAQQFTDTEQSNPSHTGSAV